MVVKFMEILS